MAVKKAIKQEKYWWKTNAKRHPYIAFIKSSSDYLNDDVVLDVSLY